jgi:phospholipid/cholesterol/gamma-HCH transport system permease protein
VSGLVSDLFADARNFVEKVGGLTQFFLRLLVLTPGGFARPRLIVDQVYNAGALSLVIIMTCGLFVGMVLGLQGYDLLARFGSEDSLGTGAALALLKELGPVVTALLFAGRAGTALASEIGLMRATDQLAALEMMAVDPMRRIVLPRFVGGVLSMPLLTAIFIMIGIFGVQLVGVQVLGVDQGSFWSQMRGAVEPADIREGLIKACCFGVACSLIAVYEGYHARATAEGVGRAATRTVVVSSVVVLVLDYVLTAILFRG